MKNTILFIFAALALVSCNNRPEKSQLAYRGDANTMSNQKMAIRSADVNETTTSQSQLIERKLIKNGTILFKTSNLDTIGKQIESLVSNYKGYISSNRTYKSESRITHSLSVRIPSDKFDLLINEISKGVEKFDEKSVQVSDVTTQFLDVQSRLKNKKALEQRYLDILKKAKSVQEILGVEKELGKLREDIEATEGQLKYLQNQVSFSTLNITFYKLTASESSFGNKFFSAIKGGLENIQTFFIFIITSWPFILIFGLVFYFIIRKRKRV